MCIILSLYIEYHKQRLAEKNQFSLELNFRKQRFGYLQADSQIIFFSRSPYRPLALIHVCFREGFWTNLELCMIWTHEAGRTLTINTDLDTIHALLLFQLLLFNKYLKTNILHLISRLMLVILWQSVIYGFSITTR